VSTRVVGGTGGTFFCIYTSHHRNVKVFGQFFGDMDRKVVFLLGVNDFNGVKVVKAIIPMSADVVKDIAFQLKGEIPANLFVVIGSVDNNKPMLTVMISEDLVKAGQNAGKLVREAAKLIQGGGGGQPHFATAGGKNPDGLNAAVDKVIELAAL
jgi:alanyl-tRNA synthetase